MAGCTRFAFLYTLIAHRSYVLSTLFQNPMTPPEQQDAKTVPPLGNLNISRPHDTAAHPLPLLSQSRKEKEEEFACTTHEV